jgi:hypothetical protein
MSDDRLRALERKWLQTRAPEDEVALVSERTRHGVTTSERLALAGYLGAPAALALGQTVSEHEPGERAWSVDLLKRWGQEALAWLDLGAARALLPWWTEARPQDPYLPRLFAALEECMLDPSEARRARLSELHDSELSDLAERAAAAHCRGHTWTAICCPHRHHYALEAVRGIASRLLAPPDPDLARLYERIGSMVIQPSALRYLRSETAPVAQAGAAEASAWALGHAPTLFRERAREVPPPPIRLVDPRAAKALAAAEARAEANPADLAALRALIRASEDAHWTLEGRSVEDYRRALRTGGGVPEEDQRLAQLIAPLGLRAVPLALEFLPRRLAFYLLVELGARAAAAVPSLVEWIGAPGGHDRSEAAQSLVQIVQGEPSLEAAAEQRVRARLASLDHPEGALFVLLRLGADPAPLAEPLRRVFARGKWGWILLFDLERPEALWPAARELGAAAVAADSTTTVRGACLNVLFTLGERALPALPELERRPGVDALNADAVQRLIGRLRAL